MGGRGSHASALLSRAPVVPGPVLSALLLFASGAASLVFQVLWVKQLSLVVGVDVYAVTIAVSAFFAGLALGSVVLGTFVDTHPRPLRVYAALELAAGLLGAAATLTLARAAAPFAALEAAVGPLAWVLPFALVGLPAVAMGGTLPVMLRALAPTPTTVAAQGGSLYAANTAGAVVGALAAPFVLIPAFGVRGAGLAAAGVYLTIAAIALVVDRRSGSRAATPPAEPAVAPAGRATRTALALYAIAGGIALGYEVVWSQVLVQFTTTRSFAFAVVLATYLSGLALGAAVAARRAERSADPWRAFGFLLGAAGLIALLEIAVLGRWLVVLQTQAELAVLTVGGSALAGMCARFATAAAAIVLIPTLLLGAAFPFALRLAGHDRVGRDTGTVVALNTVGGIVGTLLTGLVLVPGLGLVRTLAALALGAAALGIVATRGSRPTLAILAATALAALLMPADHLARAFPTSRGGTLAFYDESRGATVAVVETGRGATRFKRLYVQGVSNSGDAMPSRRYMRLQALLPVLVHKGEPKSALVIGLGTGITAGALLRVPSLERRVCAELLPAVVRAAGLFAGNFAAPRDPGLELRIRDGRRELLTRTDRYDVITLEPPPPSAAGVANLYSREFYALAASRLAPDGLLAQWLPIATQNVDETRSLVRSFLDVFPAATLWTTELHEMLLLGGRAPLVIDETRFRARFATPEIAAALGEVGVASPAALLATWVTDRAGLERWVGDAPPVTDDDPRIEYASWVRPAEVGRVLPDLLALQTPPPLAGSEADLAAAVTAEREQLHRFYRAGLAAYAGDRAAWSREMRQVMQRDGDNPYYRWFSSAP